MDIVSTRQAGEILGVSIRRVQQFIQQGRLPAIKVGKIFVVREADLVRFASLDRPAGKPLSKS